MAVKTIQAVDKALLPVMGWRPVLTQYEIKAMMKVMLTSL